MNEALQYSNRVQREVRESDRRETYGDRIQQRRERTVLQHRGVGWGGVQDYPVVIPANETPGYFYPGYMRGGA